jgi:LPS-assembly lipoprotein
LSSNLLKPATLAALLGLSACGFSPMYGGQAGSAASAQLDQVFVTNIPERPGQVLRESLETQLHADGAPTTELYALNVNYSIVSTGIGVLQDTATTRNRLTAKASWTLTPIGEPFKPLTSGTATAVNAENIIDQQYFALTLEGDTVNKELADQVAAEITAQIAAWFRAHPGT